MPFVKGVSGNPKGMGIAYDGTAVSLATADSATASQIVRGVVTINATWE